MNKAPETASQHRQDESNMNLNTNLKAKTCLLLGTLALLGPGCLGPIFSRHTTVYKDVERTRVEFESDAAARLFYETASKHPATHKRAESTTSLDIPILYEHRRTVVPGRNLEFNEAVAACDTNGDGKITELETKIFANQRQ
jgi:hypothetical protein